MGELGHINESQRISEVQAVWESHNPLLWIITAAHEGRRGGLLATFVMQASIVPSAPRALIGIGRRHHTWELIRDSRSFVAHLVDSDRLDWCSRFGMRHGHECDKLEGLHLGEGLHGGPILLDSAGWLECRVEADFDTGDRSLFLGEVVSAFRHPTRKALTLSQMLAAADAEQRRILGTQYAADAIEDSQAIQRWREERQPAEGG